MAADLATADAWWSGDPDRLAHVYGGLTAEDAHERRRPSQRIRDAFWGRLQDPTKRRERIHVPVAADIAATGADLLFGGEGLTFEVPEAHGEKPDQEARKAEDAIVALADRIGLDSTLLEAAELAGAHGGVYLRPSWDPTASDDPILWVIHADRAVPVFRMGQFVGVTFWSVADQRGHEVLRHLELHEYTGSGRDRRPTVEHALYRGTKDRLGVKVPLTEHAATAGLGLGADGLGVVPDGVRRLLAHYVPNVRPNRKHRHSWLGRPDTQGAEPLMSAIDKTMTSWMRDLDLGQRRIIVPDQYLQKGGRGQGAWFDQDQEVFSPLAIDPGSADSGTITVVDFALRTEDHNRTARALLERIVAVAQYSPQSFGLPAEGGEQTATEIDSKDKRSFRTTGRKRHYWNQPLPDAVHQLAVIDAEILGRRDAAPMRPRLVWPDLEGQDLTSLATSVEMINRAQAASIATKVRMLHPEWETEEVDAEVDAIKADMGLSVPDPTTWGGLPPHQLEVQAP